VHPTMKNLPVGHKRNIKKRRRQKNHSINNHHTGNRLALVRANQGQEFGFRKSKIAELRVREFLYTCGRL
jgi:hypothetical protein